MNSRNLMLLCIIVCCLISPSPLRPEVSISEKDDIRVYWRYVSTAVNPLDITSAFADDAVITASKSPFGGGTITGKQIVSLISKRAGNRMIVRMRVLSLKNGSNPSNKPTLSAISLRDDGSLYDNYVIKTKNGKLALYVDVLVAR